MAKRGKAGVAISTTGSEHRLGFLETAVRNWDAALAESGDVLFVTVDGDEAACERVLEVVSPWTLSVFRVGQSSDEARGADRLGVAVNKNTGLELLMDHARAVDHLFLSDDDCSPLFPQSLDKHINLSTPHSMVCWGRHRLLASRDEVAHLYAEWSWPRGVMLYTHRPVVEAVGGMREVFGSGGHEHVEWSRRIHQAGFTPAPFISPRSYAEAGPGGVAMRAAILWHCEDMPRPREPRHIFAGRKRAQTTVPVHDAAEWARIEQIMDATDGDTRFVAYASTANGRLSATLCTDL